MPPGVAAPPQAARLSRARRRRTYNLSGVVELTEQGSLQAAERVERLMVMLHAPATLLGAAEAVYAAEKRLFAAQGGGKWKPTSPETFQEKLRKGLRTEPMRATDALYRSLTMPPPQKGAVLRLLRKNTQMRVGSRLVQGVMQQRKGRDATLIDDKGRSEVVEAIRRKLLDE